MARQKSGEKKNPTAQLQISVEEFLHTRDQVVSSLATLQAAVVTLQNKYIQHTNTILGNDAFGTLALYNTFQDANAAAGNALIGDHAVGAAVPAAPLIDLEDGGKKKRKREKKPKDPNEPKKPLTAYFLYSQKARPVVKRDLGEEAKPNDIALEVLKRWQEMPDSEKQGWKEVYQQHREQYVKDMAAYKGKLAAQGINTAFEIPDDAAAGADADAVAAAPEPESESDGEGAAKGKKGAKGKAAKGKAADTPKAKRARGGKDAAAPTPVGVAPSAVPLPVADKAGAAAKRKSVTKETEEPKKKRARKSKGADEEEGAAAKKDKRGKRKSDA